MLLARHTYFELVDVERVEVDNVFSCSGDSPIGFLHDLAWLTPRRHELQHNLSKWGREIGEERQR